MSTIGLWKLVAVLALCGMAASGCATFGVTVDSFEAPQAAPAAGNKPAVTLLRIEDAITDPAYRADPTLLGEGTKDFGTMLVLPIVNESYRFRGTRPRTELVQDAFMAKLQLEGLPIRYHSEGRLEQFTNREDGHLMVSVRLKKFQVDTRLSFMIPLVVVSAFAFHNIESHVLLECQVLQPGNPTPLWQGTVEGTTNSASQHDDKPNLIRQAIMGAVEQFVQKSNLQQLSARLRNEAYAKHIKASQEREAAGDWKGAVSHYGKAYGTAVTSDQSLATIQAVAQLARKQSAKPELPEEAMRYGVQATSLVEKKRYDEAIALYDQALELAPWWADSHFNKALVLANQNRNAEAATSMKQFLVLAPNAPDARAAQNKIYEWELAAK